MNILDIVAGMDKPPADLVDDEAKLAFWKRVVAEIIMQNRNELEAVTAAVHKAINGSPAAVAVLAMQISIVGIERASTGFENLPHLMRAIRAMAEECNDYICNAEAEDRRARG